MLSLAGGGVVAVVLGGGGGRLEMDVGAARAGSTRTDGRQSKQAYSKGSQSPSPEGSICFIRQPPRSRRRRPVRESVVGNYLCPHPPALSSGILRRTTQVGCLLSAPAGPNRSGAHRRTRARVSSPPAPTYGPARGADAPRTPARRIVGARRRVPMPTRRSIRWGARGSPTDRGRAKSAEGTHRNGTDKGQTKTRKPP